jgi:PAS domain S-box-containing protein
MSDVTDSQLLQKARAFEYANEALFITDAANRIIAVNRAFTRMTGYAPHDVIGQNPRVLASGQTSPDVYYDMWLALEKNDFWQGEVWDRRRDGSTYPKHLTISVVRNAAHEVENYIASFSDMVMSPILIWPFAIPLGE